MAKKEIHPDLIPCHNPVRVDVQAFKSFPNNPIIDQEIIYWHIEGALTSDFEGVKVIEAFRGAFSILQPYFHPIRFESTSNLEDATVILHFAINGDEDLPMAFDTNVLAYAYAPYSGKSNVWFNDAMNWGDMHTSNTYSLQTVAVHELLHSLGLSHSDPEQWPRDILNPYYSPNYVISQDTEDGINYLYGAIKDRINERDNPGEEEPTNDPPVTIPAEDLERLYAEIKRLRGEMRTIKAGWMLTIDKKIEDNKRSLTLLDAILTRFELDIEGLEEEIDGWATMETDAWEEDDSE